MEPGLRDRENLPQAQLSAHVDVAAMEPGLRDRENLHRKLSGIILVIAAMEPGLRDRENMALKGHHWKYHLRRNGARPERPGKRGSSPCGRSRSCAAMEPGLGDRENQPAPAGDPVEHEAAMEPGLRDRENPAPVPLVALLGVPQWSPA